MNQEKNNNQIKLKGRSLVIFLDLCKKIDKLPSGSKLPSMRQLQQQYTASQQTITTVLNHLATVRPIIRHSRRRAQLCSIVEPSSEQTLWSEQHSTVTTLGLISLVAASWQPIIDRFNEKKCRIIKPHYVETLSELVELSQRGEIDFALFHCHPVTHGVLGNTSAFINLKDLVKTIDINNFYPGTFVTDTQNRCWGIAATLSLSIILGNRSFGRLPDKNLSWQKLLPYLERIKKKNPDLLYSLVLNGYSTYLMHEGVSMVDGITGELKFSKDKFADALRFLKKILDTKIAPLFSETHYDLASLQWFENKQIATREIFLSSLKHFITFCPDFDVLPTPAVDGVKRTVFAEFFSICASSLNYGTAWDFINFVLSVPIQKYLIKNNTIMPARRHLTPPYLKNKQFEIFAEALENGSGRPEDYYLPIQLRLIIETAVDRWSKFGGNLDDFLIDLEKSCKQQVENWKVYSP